MTTTITTPRDSALENKGFGTQIPYETISEPGAYICNWSGHLLRMPYDSVRPGRSPLMSFSANEPLLVARISEDPFIAVTKARVLAAGYGLNVNF